MKMKTCDCLNFCGDDPDLTAGKAMPCANLQAHIKKEAKLKEDRLFFNEQLTIARKDDKVVLSYADMLRFASILDSK